jgi:hydrogenase expression/formation protein HypE
MEPNKNFMPVCPIPLQDYPNILLAHGGGGRLTRQLIEKLFLPAFQNPALNQRHDGAVLESDGQRFAFTTDSYVVRPLFFPGGDIGALAVNGTVNDLAMCGARPRWLSAAVILEEGLPMETLARVVDSMRRAAQAADVELVTGDTKVVDKGKGDGLFVTTAGIGVIESRKAGLCIAPKSVQPGDTVIVSGDLGRHGIAIMSVREGLQFESAIESDCAPLAAPVLALLKAGIEVHCLRDLTRGGLASAVNEIAAAAGAQIQLDESAIPVREDVRGACEILGLDPLHVANEGRFVAFVSSRDAAAALKVLRQHAVSTGAGVIGTVAKDTPGLVTLKSCIGTTRVLDMLSGEQLPRIC